LTKFYPPWGPKVTGVGRRYPDSTMNPIRSPDMNILLNYIRMIDYSRTVEVDPDSTVRDLTAWCNRQWAAVRQKNDMLFGPEPKVRDLIPYCFTPEPAWAADFK
jgi:hypothetical protein